MDTPPASRTAVLVCQGRAAADGRIAPGRFADPTAAVLLRPAELKAVHSVWDGVPPAAWRDRLDHETVRASGELMAPRTVAVDDAVRERVRPQLVILGAGLDGRAWRMPELADVAVYEVDHPASQADKRARAAALPGRGPVFVPVDLRHERLGDALAEAGHRADTPTTWVWEGVVPYLTRAEVAASVAEIARRSAPGSRLVVNYQARAWFVPVGRALARVLMASTGRSTVLRDEPWRSTWTPTALAALLAGHGFVVAGDRSVLEVADELGSPASRRRSLGNGRVLVADL